MYILKITTIIFLFSSHLFSLTQVDSLKQLVEKSEGIKKIELSIELSKKLLERTKVADAINYANNAILASKNIKNTELEIKALSTLTRGYLISGNIAPAQEICDSILNLAIRTNSKYGLALGYQAKGILLSFSGKFESGISFIDSSLQIFDYKNYPLERALSIQTKATICSYLGNVDSSDFYLQQAMQIYKEQNALYSYAVLKLNKALIQGTVSGQYENAIKNALETLPFFEDAKDTLKISTANSIIANCYDAIGNYDKAIKYYLDAISFSEKSGNKIYLANFYNNLGEVYKHKNDFKNAHNFYKKALSIFQEIDLIEGITVTKNNIGECLINEKKYDEALIYFIESLANVDKNLDYYKLTILNRNIGTVYLKKGNFDKAISYLNNSIQFGKQTELFEEIFPAYKSLAEANANKRNYKEAYSNILKYIEAKDEFLSQSNAKRLTDIEIKYQSEKKEKEIEILTKSQEIQNLQLSNQKYITIALIVIIILIGGGSILLLRRYKFKKKTNLALEHSNKMMKRYADELEFTNYQLKESEDNLKNLNATKDKFFSIIAHDLKGPFFSLLGLSEIMSEDIDDMSIEDIKEMSKGINGASQKVFALLENLLQWARAQLGMINIEKQLFDFNELVLENSKLFKNNFEQKGIVLKSELIEDSKIFADREMINFALRNLLNNAIKFTNNNGEVTIESKKQDNNFIVSISDTGIGIDETSLKKLFKIESTFSTDGTGEEKGTGLGLILVHEFIIKNNGEIIVESKVNKGTTFTIKLPLN
ncbi:MAG: tetratricopeptide repeat-containing sensor histidine kinase [Bacteroidetes bacterium]|nr:tetratricopeptide repeat-containing sensor histidine kinase [Bacteroidota bacterium]MBU1113667.1 tetratricopeptide repeat-containing sensor histidine kinase [Bacteroidota bacterium]MBU1796747.1 tetratricopeptide repeat-containing sensor histidine kinase [Bacteroidota bacterium]